MSRLELISSFQNNSLRKFPPRSQSLRLKKPSLTRHNSSLGDSLQWVTPSKLVLTSRDLIISQASSTAVVSSPKESTKLKFRPFGSMTLSRHQSIKQQSSEESNAKHGHLTSIFVDSLPPHSPLHQEPDDESILEEKLPSERSSELLVAGETGSTEDEGVITNDDTVDESDEDELCFEDELDHSSHSRHVYLTRHDPLGLGLTIQGGAEDALPVVVAAIKSNSPADLCASLFVGDQILSVNEVPLNETTSHNDALRLLADCGNLVHLVVRHSKATSTHCTRWKRRDINGGLRPRPSMPTGLMPESKPFTKSSSMTNISRYCRVDLFLAGLTRYVSFSDRLRDASLELRSAESTSLVIHCSSEDVSTSWHAAIKIAIDCLTDSFMHFYNQHYPQREHFLYMGWISECLDNEANDNGGSSLSSQHQLNHRWLSRYLIIKGGCVYLLKGPPAEVLRLCKQRLTSTTFRRHRSGSSGSSLGSVGSSGSEASNSSNGTSGPWQSIEVLGSKMKPDRINRVNRDLENDLRQQSMAHFACYACDFCPVLANQLLDQKKSCFVINGGAFNHKYFSIEDEQDLERLKRAWTRANYNSVIQIKVKTFTVTLEPANAIGSLILDWRFGFTYYDPRRKQNLWSYKFHQLKNSSDDGQSKLLLTFVLDPSDVRITKTYVLHCSCLRTLIYSIHAFLSAKVYSLHI